MPAVPIFLPFATGLGTAPAAAADSCALVAFGVSFAVAAAGFFMTFDGFAIASSTRAEAATTLKRSFFCFGRSGDPEGAGDGEESELPRIGGNGWLDASRGPAHKVSGELVIALAATCIPLKGSNMPCGMFRF